MTSRKLVVNANSLLEMIVFLLFYFLLLFLISFALAKVLLCSITSSYKKHTTISGFLLYIIVVVAWLLAYCCWKRFDARTSCLLLFG